MARQPPLPSPMSEENGSDSDSDNLAGNPFAFSSDMAVPISANRPTSSNYLTDESYEVVTHDNEDHSFYGMMFDLRGKDDLPVQEVMVYQIWVRGNLGSVSVWYTNGSFDTVKTQPGEWTQVYSEHQTSSYGELVPLYLHKPIPVRPGELTGLFIHTQDRNGLIYDNRNSDIVFEDRFVKILPGMAHMDGSAFGNRNPFGPVGRGAFRSNRIFVGRLQMGAKYALWNPEIHQRFPPAFRSLVRTLLLCSRRSECWLSRVSDEVLFWLLNMCRWDWPAEASEGLPIIRGPVAATGFRLKRYRGNNTFHEPEGLISDDDEWYSHPRRAT